MKALIAINMSGAAFVSPEEDEALGDTEAWTATGLREVARLLRLQADRLDKDDVSEHLIDANGQAAGSFVLVTDEHAPEVAHDLAINPAKPPR